MKLASYMNVLSAASALLRVSMYLTGLYLWDASYLFVPLILPTQYPPRTPPISAPVKSKTIKPTTTHKNGMPQHNLVLLRSCHVFSFHLLFPISVSLELVGSRGSNVDLRDATECCRRNVDSSDIDCRDCG